MRTSHKPCWPYVLNAGHDQAQGLVGWWPGGLSGGPRLFDLCRGNNGTLTNFSAPYTRTSGWVSGYQGGNGALAFDGVDDFVSIGTGLNSYFDYTSKFTVSAFVKFFALIPNVSQGIFSNFDIGNSLIGFCLRWEGSPTELKWKVFLSNSFPSNSITVDFSVPTSGVIYHIALTYDGSGASTGMKFYVNGSPVAITKTDASTISATSVSSIAATIGKDGAGAFLSGTVEDLKIHKRAISAQEAAAMYANPWALRYQPGRRTIFAPAAPAASAGSFWFGAA